jgi:hypothetical protein
MVTKIYGLTGVGNTEYTGLAMSRNDVVITAYSSNYSQPNFKYIFAVGNVATGQELKFYQEQNFNNSASFNLKGIMMNVIQESILDNTGYGDLITATQEFISHSIFTNQIRVQCYAGYDIAGVFTEDQADFQQYDLMVLDGEGDDCYIPLGLADNQIAGALVEKNENRTGFNRGTYNQDLKDVRISFRGQNQCTWFLVPRRRRWRGTPQYGNWEFHYSSHYRSLVFIADDGTYLNNQYPYRQIGYFRIIFYDYSNYPLGNCTIQFTTAAGCLFVLPTGLQNLEEGGYLATAGITDTSIVKSWVIQMQNQDNTDTIFWAYGYYIEDECCNSEVSLTWLNRFGGFESMGFVKKNERTLSTEKKRVMMTEGNYATATPETFEIGWTSRNLKEKEPIKTMTMTLNTGWINEEEFRRLKYLVSSRSVWMEDSNFDGGKLLPVVIETNNFTSKRERNGKKYNASIEVRMAYSQRNLGLMNTNSEGSLSKMTIEPTPPDPCVWASANGHSGNSGLVPTYYTIPIPITCTDVGSQHHISLHCTFQDSTYFEDGGYYCVKLDWDSGMPTDISTSADLGTIELNGTPDVYWDGNNYLLTTGWNTIIKNTPTSDQITIQLPNFIKKQSWSGVLTLHIKKVTETCACGGY